MEKIRVGKILSAHGIRGEVSVLPLTDNPNRFKKLNRVFLFNDEIEKQSLHIKTVRFNKKDILLTFEEINTRNEAEALKHYYLCIEKSERMQLPQNTYFIDDLIGINVFENEKFLGSIVEVLQPGSNDVYVLESDVYPNLCIPAIKSVVLSVDIEDKKMLVQLPKGLVD